MTDVTDQPETVVDGLAFAEGLRWREGRLWYSDMHAGEVHAWSADQGDTVTLRLDGSPSGLGWTPGGDLLVVSMDDRRLLQVDRHGRIGVLADLGDATAHPINDMTVDAEGRAYIGAFGFDLHGGERPRPAPVFRVDPDGSFVVAAADLAFPNGMVLTDGDRTLVVAESFGGRLTAFTRHPDGSLTDQRLWAALPEGVFPDGICVDPAGAIWVASPSTRECIRVAEGGRVEERVPAGDRMAIACALGGPDGRTLFVASSAHASPDEARRHRDSRIDATPVSLR